MQGLPRISSLKPDTPARLDELVASLVSSDPSARPQDGQAVAAAIAHAQGAPAPTAAQPTPPAPKQDTSDRLRSTDDGRRRQPKRRVRSRQPDPICDANDEWAEAQAPAAAPQAPPPDTEDLEPPKPKSKMPLVAALVLLIGGGGYAAYDYKLEQDRIAAENQAKVEFPTHSLHRRYTFILHRVK